MVTINAEANSKDANCKNSRQINQDSHETYSDVFLKETETPVSQTQTRTSQRLLTQTKTLTVQTQALVKQMLNTHILTIQQQAVYL